MALWTFACYDDLEEVDLWTAWYNRQGPEVQGAHDGVLSFLEAREIHEWREPYSKVLDKNERIIEICIHGRVEYRILGFFGPARKQFTILLICSHKGKVYDPPEARKTAVKLKTAIENGKANVRPCERP